MDRVIAYVDENILVEDFLNSQKNTLIALGAFMQAVFGTATWVDGLACTPTSPPSLQVQVAKGSIYSIENVDNSAYGPLSSDTTHQIIKQGISLGITNFTLTPPSTSGQSINYLIQAEYQDVDAGSTVLPYYNASNPSVAYSGPSNTGVSQNTLRQGQVVMSLKAGAAATTGTQTTPTPDAGYTGLWVVTVANGATTLTSGNIAPYSGATAATGAVAAWAGPLMLEKLNDKISIATGDLRYAPLVGGGGTSRTRLSGTTNYFVNASTGNDSTGNGTSGNPWQTIEHALAYVASNIDIAGQICNINLAAGTYTSAAVNAPFVGGTPTLVGDTTTPSNCTISVSGSGNIDAFSVFNGAEINLAGLKFTTTTSGNGLACYGGGRALQTGKCEWGACAGSAVFARNAGSFIGLEAAQLFSGSVGQSMLRAEQDGQVYCVSTGCTLSNTPNFPSGFASVITAGTIIAQGYTNSGSVGAGVNPYWSVATAGVIDTGGVAPGSNYFPGNAAGIGLTPNGAPYGLIT